MRLTALVRDSMENNKLKAGFARTAVPVKLGWQLSGFAIRMERPCTAVLDPLYVRTVVFDRGPVRIAVLCFDVLALDWGFVDRVRGSISAAFGFEKSHVILCSTHTHSAPAAVYLSRTGRVEADFIRNLEHSALVSVKRAVRDLQDVTLGSCSVRVPDQSYNRRAVLEDGRVAMSRFPNGNVVRTGPIDEEFGTLKFESNGKAKGVILNFGSHACSVCEQGITADYPGELCRLVEETLDEKAVAIF